MNTQPSWTDERIKNLIALLGQGLSAAQIAERMGVTRNTIIGKARRIGGRFKRSRERPAPPRPRRAKPKPLIFVRPKPKPIVITYPTTEFSCTIHELTVDMCRFPYGEPTHDMHYCGAPCDGSWCGFHRSVVFSPRAQR